MLAAEKRRGDGAAAQCGQLRAANDALNAELRALQEGAAQCEEEERFGCRLH